MLQQPLQASTYVQNFHAERLSLRRDLCPIMVSNGLPAGFKIGRHLQAEQAWKPITSASDCMAGLGKLGITAPFCGHCWGARIPWATTSLCEPGSRRPAQASRRPAQASTRPAQDSPQTSRRPAQASPQASRRPAPRPADVQQTSSRRPADVQQTWAIVVARPADVAFFEKY